MAQIEASFMIRSFAFAARITSLFVVLVLFSSVSMADPDLTLPELQARKTQVEQQIRNIADAPARPGESLNDEIRRKGEETRALRQELEQLDNQISALQAQQNDTPAEQPPAVTAGGASTPQPAESNTEETNEFHTVPPGAGYNAEVVDGPGRFGQGRFLRCCGQFQL